MNPTAPCEGRGPLSADLDMKMLPKTAPPNEWPPAFEPSIPSRASRRLPKRSSVSAVGRLVNPKTRHRIGFQSMIEMHTALVLMARPDLVDLIDQPSPITYRGQDGVEHRHTFDFLATFDDGQRIAIECKAEWRAKRDDLEGFYRSLATKIPRTFADRIKVVTEASFSQAQIYDATLLYDCRRDPSNGFDTAVRTVASGLFGSVSVATLIATINGGDDGATFRAIVRAIGAGILVKLSTGPFDYATSIGRYEVVK